MGATAISWFEGKVNKMAVPTGKMSLERTSEDFKIDEMTAYVMNLERCIVRVARQVCKHLRHLISILTVATFSVYSRY